MVRLNTPLKSDEVRSLKMGDKVILNGIIYTGRLKINKYLATEKDYINNLPFELKGGVIYHSGPIIKQKDGDNIVISAGPTTSNRIDLYQSEVIKKYGIKAVIGKGGMGLSTIKVMQEYECVYLHVVSGAGVYLADRVKKVIGGWMIEEFGDSEAMWALEVEDFPAIVSIDASGNSLHKIIRDTSKLRIKELI